MTFNKKILILSSVLLSIAVLEGAYLITLVTSPANASPIYQNAIQEKSYWDVPIVVPTNTPEGSKDQIQAIVSYFTASVNETDDEPCITADGTNICNIEENIIAANWLPFNTKVKIDGKIYRVADRMNQRYQKPYVDILVKTKFEARRLGRQKKMLEVVTEEPKVVEEVKFGMVEFERMFQPVFPSNTLKQKP